MASTTETPDNTADDKDVAPTACLRRSSNPNHKLRFVFEYNGRPIYEWEQSLEEVVLYVPSPRAKIRCEITPTRLRLGLQGSQKFVLDEDFLYKVDTNESTWTVEDGMVVIYLQKANKGLVWEAALKGHEHQHSSSPQQQQQQQAARLDPLQLEQVRQELMREKWQAENPGFDFRDAEFSGSSPDPRTFMGGVKYD